MVNFIPNTTNTWLYFSHVSKSIFPNIFSDLYCGMEKEPIDIIKAQLILEDKSQYFYSIKSVEICNSLGAVMATLVEYVISNHTSQNYKLYRTKEGNWYDVPDVNPTSEKALLMFLKMAINSQEKAK